MQSNAARIRKTLPILLRLKAITPPIRARTAETMVNPPTIHAGKAGRAPALTGKNPKSTNTL